MVTRIVFGILSAVVASTLSILVTATDEQIRAWSVATGASLFVTAMCWYALLEIRALRSRLDDNEQQTRALISALEREFHDHEHDGHPDARGLSDNGNRRPRRRRPPRRVRGSEAAAGGTGELLSQQFQMYLRGRESRFDDDPPMTT